MKKTLSLLLCLLLLLLTFAACNSKDSTDPWSNASYTKDTSFGEGSVKIECQVIVNDHSVTFTVNTDATYLDKALLEHKLIEGEDGDYGLYIKKVNGIEADYDKTQTYWGLSIGGEYAMTGISDIEVTEGAHYELTYTKG